MSPSTRGRSKNHNTTRKRKATSVTLPELKATFDQLRKQCHEILRSTKDTKQRIRKFQAVWKELFHRPVDAMAAESYLRVMDKKASGRNTKKAKNQKGGRMDGAPLDFQTRPGVDGVHGSFPAYLTGGLSFYNTINQEAMFKDCGTQDITPAVPYDMGSNKVGGGLGDVLFLATTRPSDSAVPPSAIEDIQTFAQGRLLGASPNASQNPLRYVP